MVQNLSTPTRPPTSRPRVVYCIDSLGLAGTETYLAQLLPRLQDRFEPLVVVNHLVDSPIVESFRAAGIPIHHAPVHDRFRLREALRLGRRLRELRPDIVHTLSNCYYAEARAGALLMTSAALVMDVRTSFSHKFAAKKRFVEIDRRLRRFTDAFLFCSPESRDDYLHHCKVNGGPVPDSAEWLNGIDAAPFLEPPPGFDPREKLKSLGLPSNVDYVGIMARFHPLKRHDLFIHAAARVLRHRHHTHFLLIGDGLPEDRLRIESLIAAENLQDRVHLLGLRTDVPELLRLLDVFVLCSDYEGFNRSVLEAALCGRAIVASAANCSSFFREGREVIRAQTHDADGYAAAILTLLSDEGVRTRLGAAAAARARELDIADAADAVAAVYTRILERGPASRRLRRLRWFGLTLLNQLRHLDGRL